MNEFVSADDPLGSANGENTKFELAWEPIPGTVEIPGMIESHDFHVSGTTLIFRNPPLNRPLTNYKRKGPIMTNESRQKLEKLCSDLRRRAAVNRPFDAEQLIDTLLILGEELLALAPATPAPAATPAKEKLPADTPPDVPKTVTRHE